MEQASEASLLADEDEVRARTLEVIGKYTDSATDVSEHVDRYLAEALAP